MDNHPENWVSNLEVSINGGKKIGVPEVLDAKDMANPNVEYLGVMAWVAQFQWIPDKTAPGDRLEMRCNLNKIKVGEEVSFFFFFCAKLGFFLPFLFCYLLSFGALFGDFSLSTKKWASLFSIEKSVRPSPYFPQTT